MADTVAEDWLTAGEGAGAKVMVCGRASIRGPSSHPPSAATARAARSEACGWASWRWRMRVLGIRWLRSERFKATLNDRAGPGTATPQGMPVVLIEGPWPT